MTDTERTSERLRLVMSQVLGLPGTVPAADIAMESQPAWDSMAHINLILAVEQEFRVALSPEEAAEAITFDEFLAIVERKR